MKLKEYKYRINGMKFTVGIGDMTDDTIHVEVNGTPYNVELDQASAPKAAKIAAMTKKPEAAPRTDSGEKVIAKPTQAAGRPDAVKAPLPGTLTAFKVTVGQTVEAGATIALLEAMKMENEIHAPKSGTVKELCANVGDALAEGADILIIE